MIKDYQCMFCTPTLADSPHAMRLLESPIINWIQICRIRRPQLRRDTFWSFFLQQLNDKHCKCHKIV